MNFSFDQENMNKVVILYFWYFLGSFLDGFGIW